MSSEGSGPTGYRALYHRWEKEHWEAGAAQLPAQVHDAAALDAAVSPLAVSADMLTTMLGPLVDAIAEEDAQVVATTHLADAARQVVLFHRLLAEVVGVGGDVGEHARTLVPQEWGSALDRAAAATRYLGTRAGEAAVRAAVTSIYDGVEGEYMAPAVDRARGVLEQAGSTALSKVARDLDRHAAWARLLLSG